MRILAVRGQNLASLPRFELSFTSGPLARSNLFAITGPTGAGKSTLLDAICLALYGCTPRLSGQSAVRIGYVDAERDLRVGAVDPRSILRRGAGEGFAQADFTCVEGKAWRATWGVHRARRRADGALQQPRVQLASLPDERDVTRGTNSETWQLIEEKVGLNFTQFRRSILLAQGEFAAFLRASHDDRAALLEKMTGTELYAWLSREAFTRARSERERLAALHSERAALGLLQSDERADLEAGAARAGADRTAAADEWERVRETLARFEERRRLDAELADAAGAAERLQREWDALAPARAELERASLVHALRPLLAERERAASEGAEAAARLVEAESRVASAALALEAARAHELAAGAGLAAAREERDRLAPELLAARELDAAAAAADERAGEVARDLEAAEATLDRARTRRDAAERGLASAEADAAASAAWLGERPWLEALADLWPGSAALVEDFAGAEERLEALRADLDARCAGAADSQASAAAFAVEVEDAARVNADASAAVRDLERQLSAVHAEMPPEILHAELARVGEAGALAEALAGVVEQAVAAHGRRAADAESLRGLAEKMRRAETRLASADARLSALRDEVSGARGAYAKALDVESFAARRGELLADGEPCPLCGSLEHPWGDVHMPESEVVRRLAGLLESLEAEAADCEREAVAARQDIATGRARVADLDARAAADDLELASLEERRADIEEALRACGFALDAAGDPAAVGRVAALRGELALARDALDAVAVRSATLRASLDAARVAASAAAAALEAMRAAHGRASGAHVEAQIARERAEEAWAAADAERNRTLNRLSDLLAAAPEWAGELVASPSAFYDARREEVAARDELAEARAAAERLADSYRRELTAVAREVDRAEDAAAAKARDARDARERCARLADERRGLIGGRPEQDVQREVAERLARAEREWREAFEDAAVAERELAAAAGASDREVELLERARSREAEALGRVERELGAIGIASPEDAAGLLARGDEWLEERRAEVGRAADALKSAQVTVEDRRARVEAYSALPAECPALEDLRARSADARAAVERHSARLGVAASRLAADDANRARAEALLPELDRQQKASETWDALDELIGSSDGKKFRKFAQSLTLDLLLAYANVHLAQLRPRFRLGRVPGHEMELQVTDADMGDEVRSTASLSGGESFLVSLALALALSSLAAGSVRVESMFIDEGFGTLDKDALEVAVATLDQLQAEGRTVGLISHVPDLAERIGFQVSVRPCGPGKSTVFVQSDRADWEPTQGSLWARTADSRASD